MVSRIVSELSLEPHPEGGYYRETYRSKVEVTETDEKIRSAGTGIYFLLPAKVCTNWHRVSSDELWHFYKGDDLVLELIDEEKQFIRYKLGNSISDGAFFQQLVPTNCWQRAYSIGSYSLVGCTVSPGFEFEDFEMLGQEELAKQYPEIAQKILFDPFSVSNS
ncbi:cupin domain-containing protein [Aliifodinibius halophilus]|uniref:Cupin domain-containing protein n=1 Tax=Fodinibius halophilus TaxID=1736908 RepID=A0A6M1T091_9BACT|nr:cupin domain-containing protein [Fodinibius halophilus]